MANGNGKAGGIGRLFIRKSVEQMHAEHEHGELKKSLGALNLVLLGIGCIIGTGIFVLTGRAAAEFAGPGIMISFIITGTLCALVALSYAELAAAIPVSGSAYSYSYASMGEIVAWVMGLLLVLEYGLAASTVAVGWSGYVVSFLHDFNIIIPPALTAAPGATAGFRSRGSAGRSEEGSCSVARSRSSSGPWRPLPPFRLRFSIMTAFPAGALAHLWPHRPSCKLHLG